MINYVIEWETVNRCWGMININLVEQNKHYREAIEGIGNAWKLTNDYQEYMNAIHDIIKDLEESK